MKLAGHVVNHQYYPIIYFFYYHIDMGSIGLVNWVRAAARLMACSD